MMGERKVQQDALFYEFSLERHVPEEHLRSIDRFVELDGLRRKLEPFYSAIDQPSMPRTGIMKDNSMRCRASKRDHQACPLKPRYCPRAPARSRSIFEGARDLAREIVKTEASDLAAPAQKGRDAIRTPQAHSEARPTTITRSQWGSR